MDNQEQQNNFQPPQQPTIQGPPPQNPQPQSQPPQQTQISQPQQAQPPQQPQQPQQPQVPVDDPGKGLGIASLILGILGVSLVALPLGIIARKKSKTVGMSNTPALIGIILSIINLVLVTMLLLFALMNFGNAQDAAKEAEMSSLTTQSQAKIEEYYFTNGQYPKDVNDLKDYLTQYGAASTAERLTELDSYITYNALKSGSATSCTGANLDCQAYELVGDASYWGGDTDIIKVNR